MLPGAKGKRTISCKYRQRASKGQGKTKYYVAVSHGWAERDLFFFW
jgi:hypothetical protein